MMRIHTVLFVVLLSGCAGLAQTILVDGVSDSKIDSEKKSVANDTTSTNQADSDIRFLMNTGLDYAEEGEYEAAERAYLRALEKDPTSPELLFRLSTLYTMMNRIEEAVEILEKQAKLFPENPLFHNNLAWCYATESRVRNIEKALWHVREALLFAPYAPHIWNTLAETYYVAGDYQKALRSSEMALNLLSGLNPAQDQIQSFNAQRDKILRAQDAMKTMETLTPSK